MNVRHVRKKIKAVGNIKKITRAMELVSAVKMKKSQLEAIQSRPYQETLEIVIKNITRLIDQSVSLLLKNNLSTKNLIILISTNKGLCGAFNFNLFRFCLKNIDLKNSEFIILGKLGSFYISKFSRKIIADYSNYKGDASVSAIYNLAVSKYLTNQYKQISLVYNRFISAVKYQPVNETLLPIILEKDFSKSAIKPFAESYLIEPKPELIFDSLIRNFIEQKIRAAIISSAAGEHSARMLSMKNATDNATQLIIDLTLVRNKLRQEKITYELLDMITAKESVEN